MKSTRNLGEPIGDRIRVLRMQRGWSVRRAADMAGISHSQWSRIERGERSADNRFILAAIAQALQVALSDLTGHIGMGADQDRAEVRMAIYHMMQSVIESDLDDPPPGPPGPVAPLLQQLDLAVSLRLKCDYLGVASVAPDLLRRLHSAALGPEREAALRAFVLAAETVSIAVHYLGDPASSVLVADRCRQAATLLQDPVMLGVGSWAQAHAAGGCGLYPRMERIANRAATEIQGNLKLPHAHELLGMLCLTSAFSCVARGDVSGADAALAEADRLAKITGQSPALAFHFGPVNVAFWRIAMGTDGGDPGRAVQIARQVDPGALETIAIGRRTVFYLDTARALAYVRKDKEALRMLLLAERLGPQRVRLSPLVAETVRALLERARRGQGWSELRGLCERVGVPW